jgi:hypothetical protein
MKYAREDLLLRLILDARTRLRAHWRMCEQVKKFGDEAALTMAIHAVLMTLSFTLPFATLAVKIGIKKLCHCPA